MGDLEITLARHSCDTNSCIAILSQDRLHLSDMGKWLHLQDICHEFPHRSWCPPPGASAAGPKKEAGPTEEQPVSFKSSAGYFCPAMTGLKNRGSLHAADMAGLTTKVVTCPKTFSSPNLSFWAQGIVRCAGTSGIPAKARQRNTKTTFADSHYPYCVFGVTYHSFIGKTQ